MGVDKWKDLGAPNTPEEVVRAWDEDRSLWSVELGGLGPGYEQAIQTLMVELLRSAGPLPKDGDETGWLSWGNDVVSRHDKALGGLSGAQVGQARSFASFVIQHGMHAALEQVEPDRRIQVCKRWPRAAEAP